MSNPNDMGITPRTEPMVKVIIMPSKLTANVVIEPGATTLKEVLEKVKGYKYNSRDQVIVDNKTISDHKFLGTFTLQDGNKVFVTTNEMSNS